MKHYLFILITISTLSSTSITAQSKWTNLFNGKDLSGWKAVGGRAKFEVENGEIVGISIPNIPNSFLITEKEFGDFIFEAEFKIDKGINSGIQFRSHQKANGEVYGFQMEIDHSPRLWSGGVQDESRRSWLYPLDLNPNAKKAYQQPKWNKYRIECIGSTIRTWVNGVPAVHLLDNTDLKGFIGLQVHSLYKPEDEGKKIRWKNLRIQTENLKPSPSDDIYVVSLLPNELSKSEVKEGWELLWDGKTTNGWRSIFGTSFPQTGWVIKDNSMVVVPTDGSETGNDIVTKEQYGPFFELRFDFWFTPGANSGVKYFVDEQYKTDSKSGIGLEFQILDDDLHPDAKLGSVSNRTIGSLYDLIPSKKYSWVAGKPNQWNQGRIVCYPDGKVEHYVNNLLAVSYQRGGQIYDALVARSKHSKWKGFGLANSGHILLQDHGNAVAFRSIKIKKLVDN